MPDTVQTAIDALAVVVYDTTDHSRGQALLLAEALADAGVTVPQPVCGDRWDDDTTCVLPPAHNASGSWHASAPSWSPERGVKTGQTWTP